MFAAPVLKFRGSRTNRGEFGDIDDQNINFTSWELFQQLVTSCCRSGFVATAQTHSDVAVSEQETLSQGQADATTNNDIVVSGEMNRNVQYRNCGDAHQPLC